MSLLSVSVMRERGNKRERGLVSGRLEIRERGVPAVDTGQSRRHHEPREERGPELTTETF